MSGHSIWLMVCLAACGGFAVAQNAAPPKEAPANETLEPAVDTSAPVATQNPESKAHSKPSAQPGKSAPAAPQSQATAREGKALDRLELDTTQITGNRELPKVLYIVPWKRADLGDLLGKPVNSLLDEVLEPVDRDVFKRENRYYGALQSNSAPATPTSAPQAPAGHSE